jgi:cyclohexanecarboxylate-CoA ligase
VESFHGIRRRPDPPAAPATCKLGTGATAPSTTHWTRPCARPNKLALTAWRTEDDAVRRFSYASWRAWPTASPSAWHRLGVRRHDVVACQLPNWWQFTLLYLACTRIGAVMNPLMHIFRERELRFMLRHGEAKVMIAPQRFRGFDLRPCCAGSPSCRAAPAGRRRHGPRQLRGPLSGPAWEDAPTPPTSCTPHAPRPDDITQLIYTSGTTGEPKGVMHSANTVRPTSFPMPSACTWAPTTWC